MKGKNKKRRIAKKTTVDHPLYLFLFSMIVIIFGGTALFINLNRVYGFSPFVNFAAGAGITLLGVVSSILFFTNLSKIQKAEIRGKLKKLNRRRATGKPFTLVKKRNYSGNCLLIAGALSVWVFWLVLPPVKEFSSVGFWIFRVCSIAATISGCYLSFVFPKKMLVYKNGFLIVFDGENSEIIQPSDLKKWSIIPDRPTRKDLRYAIRNTIFCDVVLFVNDREIVLKKADYNFITLKAIIKEIQNEPAKIRS